MSHLRADETLEDTVGSLRLIFAKKPHIALILLGKGNTNAGVFSVLEENFGTSPVRRASDVIRHEANIFLLKRLSYSLQSNVVSGRVAEGFLDSVARILSCVDYANSSLRFKLLIQQAGNLAALISLFGDLSDRVKKKLAVRKARKFLVEGGPLSASESDIHVVRDLISGGDGLDARDAVAKLRAKGCNCFRKLLEAYSDRGKKAAGSVMAKFLRRYPVVDLVDAMQSLAKEYRERVGPVVEDGTSNGKRGSVSDREDEDDDDEDSGSSSGGKAGIFQRSGGSESDDSSGSEGRTKVKEKKVAFSKSNPATVKKHADVLPGLAELDEDDFASTDSEQNRRSGERDLKENVKSPRVRRGQVKKEAEKESRIDIDNLDEDDFAPSGDDGFGDTPEKRVQGRARTSDDQKERDTPTTTPTKGARKSQRNLEHRAPVEPVSPFSASDDDRERHVLRKRKRLSDVLSPVGASPQVKRKRSASSRHFSEREDELLRHGLQEFGWGQWKRIACAYDFDYPRSNVQLKDRARSMGLDSRDFPKATVTGRGRPPVHAPASGRTFRKRRATRDKSPEDEGDEIEESKSSDASGEEDDDDGDENADSADDGGQGQKGAGSSEDGPVDEDGD